MSQSCCVGQVSKTSVQAFRDDNEDTRASLISTSTTSCLTTGQWSISYQVQGNENCALLDSHIIGDGHIHDHVSVIRNNSIIDCKWFLP